MKRHITHQKQPIPDSRASRRLAGHDTDSYREVYDKARCYVQWERMYWTIVQAARSPRKKCAGLATRSCISRVFQHHYHLVGPFLEASDVAISLVGPIIGDSLKGAEETASSRF